jgi:hypothetical protein
VIQKHGGQFPKLRHSLLSAGIGLVQPFAWCGCVGRERFGDTEVAEGLSWAVPGWQGSKQARARLYRCPFPHQLDRQAIQHLLHRLTGSAGQVPGGKAVSGGKASLRHQGRSGVYISVFSLYGGAPMERQ